ncbi:MAG: DNA methyltransferase [Candidatus Micrarchaeia archaeon]
MEFGYNDYIKIKEKTEGKILIENENIFLEIGKEIKLNGINPIDFDIEVSNVWSFPDRGTWATHKLNVKFRGNWSPYVPRNLILLYSQEGDLILDAFCGSGTTLIEAKLLRRKAIGVDINPYFLAISYDRLIPFSEPGKDIKLFLGNATNLEFIENESVDFICTHPPYANAIKYSNIEGDLSRISNIESFLDRMEEVAKEFYRVLKRGKICAFMIGDIRRNKKHILLAYKTLERFLKVGFELKEDIIKIQHNMKTTPLWKNKAKEKGFLLLSYEHIFVFVKP